MARSRIIMQFENEPKRVKLTTENEPVAWKWAFDALPYPAQSRIMQYIAHGYREHRRHRFAWNTLELMLVSKSWHDGIASRVKHVHIKRSDHVRKLNRFSNASVLHVCTSHIEECNLTKHPRVTKLCFHDVHPYKVLNLYKDTTQITDISWSGDLTRGKCLHAFYRWIIEHSQLRSLELIGKYSYCDFCYKDYAEMTSLTQFTLKHSSSISSGIIQNICSLPNLRKLEIIRVEFEPKLLSWNELFDVIESSSLKEVTLSRNLVITDESPPKLHHVKIRWLS